MVLTGWCGVGSGSEDEGRVEGGESGSEKGLDGEDEEEEWRTLQESMKVQQEKKKERGSKDSFPAHAPFFPDVSYISVNSSAPSHRLQ